MNRVESLLGSSLGSPLLERGGSQKVVPKWYLPRLGQYFVTERWESPLPLPPSLWFQYF